MGVPGLPWVLMPLPKVLEASGDLQQQWVDGNGKGPQTAAMQSQTGRAEWDMPKSILSRRVVQERHHHPMELENLVSCSLSWGGMIEPGGP